MAGFERLREVIREGEIDIPEELFKEGEDLVYGDKWLHLWCSYDERPQVEIPVRNLYIILSRCLPNGTLWPVLCDLVVQVFEDGKKEICVFADGFKDETEQKLQRFGQASWPFSKAGQKGLSEFYPGPYYSPYGGPYYPCEVKEQYREAGFVGVEELPERIDVLATAQGILDYAAQVLEAQGPEEREAIPIPTLVAVSETV